MTVPFLVGAASPPECSVRSLEDLVAPSSDLGVSHWL